MPSTMDRRVVHLILAPYHTGIIDHGVGRGPRYLLLRGLKESLEAVGAIVTCSWLAYASDEFEGDIGRSFGVIREIAHHVDMATRAGHFPVALAGNCNATVGVAAALRPKSFGVVWFDAHTDLDTPDETVSGYFDGMGVSMLAGQSWRALMETVPGHEALPLQRFVYCGVRDLSEPQTKKLEECPAQVVYGGDLGRAHFPLEFGEAMNRTDFTEAVVHIDLDCLDTTIGKANEYAAPGGLQEVDLLNCLFVLSTKVRPLALTVASFDPTLEGGDQIADAGVRAIFSLVSQVLGPGRLPDHQPLTATADTPSSPLDGEARNSLKDRNDRKIQDP